MIFRGSEINDQKVINPARPASDQHWYLVQAVTPACWREAC